LTLFNFNKNRYYTVEGEFSVANFLVNLFYRLRGRPVACVACSTHVLYGCRIGGDLPIFLPSFLYFPPCQSRRFRVSAFVSATTMTPQPDAARYILIKALLKEGFETKLIASEALCSVSAVQRIRPKRQQFEMPTPRTNRVGRRSCIMLLMIKFLCDILIKRPYLYRCEIADFFIVGFEKSNRKDQSVRLCYQ
jgi:hypothetical protein